MMRHGKPTVITAKFGGVCAHCRQEFSAGAKIVWGKGHPTKHVECPPKPALSETAPPSSELAEADPPSEPVSAPPSAPKIRVRTPSPKPAVDAPFEIFERWDPMRRAALTPLLTSVIGDNRRYTTRGPARRGDATGTRLAGTFIVVGVGQTRFFSDEDSDDFGDGGGAYWSVQLFLREATPEESARRDAEGLAAGLPRVFASLGAMIDRIKRRLAAETVDAAAAQPGWVRFALPSWEHVPAEVREAAHHPTVVWAHEGSYVHSFVVGGETLFSTHEYIYDFDQPTYLIAPVAMVERAMLVAAVQAWGWALYTMARRMERAEKATVSVAA